MNEKNEKNPATEFNGGMLAYLGDAQFELLVRKKLILKKGKLGELNKEADALVRAGSQSKAADKLLSVRNVSAAFALIRIVTTVFISARSEGSINVQLILERIGGGGHFDVAGAALADTTLEAAEALLTETIDSYFDNSQQKTK